MSSLASENSRLRATLTEQSGNMVDHPSECQPAAAPKSSTDDSSVPPHAIAATAVRTAVAQPPAPVLDRGAATIGNGNRSECRASTPRRLSSYASQPIGLRVQASVSSTWLGLHNPVSGAVSSSSCVPAVLRSLPTTDGGREKDYFLVPAASAGGCRSRPATPRATVVVPPQQEEVATRPHSLGRTTPAALFAGAGVSKERAVTPRRVPDQVARSTSLVSVQPGAATPPRSAPVTTSYGWAPLGAPLVSVGPAAKEAAEPPADERIPVGTSAQQPCPAVWTGLRTPPAMRSRSAATLNSCTATPQNLLQVPAFGATAQAHSTPSSRGSLMQAGDIWQPGDVSQPDRWTRPGLAGACQTPPRPRPRECMLRKEALSTGPTQRRRGHVQKSMPFGCH